MSIAPPRVSPLRGGRSSTVIVGVAPRSRSTNRLEPGSREVCRGGVVSFTPEDLAWFVA